MKNKLKVSHSLNSHIKEIKELKKQKLVFRKILDISDEGFLIVNENGYITDINKTYCNYIGISKEDIIGKYVLDVIKNSNLPKVLATGEEDINVIHKLVKNQFASNESQVVVNRGAVKYKGKIIAAVGQIKFSKTIMMLAENLKKIDSELEYYKKELKRVGYERYSFDNMIGKNKKLMLVKNIAQKAVKNDFTVLITGETGTGKEVFANSIHYASLRRDKPFIRVNCAAIPAELLESELFGYSEGSFTGAKKGGKKGKFELANGGTIFLDEIGDMSMDMQAKLLRVLQEKEIEKVGSEKPLSINVRIIAATNKNLIDAINNKTFREDLFYRLNVLRLELPPLRERHDDVELFVKYFLDELNEKYETRMTISDSAVEVLKNYLWPGNVRELKNVIYNAYNMAENSILESDLPLYIFYKSKISNNLSTTISNRNLDSLVNEFEREIIINTLKRNNFNCNVTAKELGIHRSTLYKKFERLNICPKE